MGRRSIEGAGRAFGDTAPRVLCWQGAWQGSWEEQGQACALFLVAFGSLGRAAELAGEGALLELALQPGRVQPPRLFDPRGFKGKAWLRGSRHSQQEQPRVLPLSRTFTNQPESTSGGGQRCYPHLAGGELLLILLLTFLSLLLGSSPGRAERSLPLGFICREGCWSSDSIGWRPVSEQSSG